MNNVNLVGRLSRDPETRNGNTTVTTIFVATDRPKLRDGKTYKDESGYTAKETEFHKVTCFNGLATAVANNRNKGDLVAVEGRLHYTRWQDADGNDRYGCEIIADRFVSGAPHMPHTDLFDDRDIARATRKLAALQRHAERRDRFLDALDFDALDPQTQREICMEDHHLAEQISFGPIYLYHLETLEAQRAAIAASIPLAA